MTWLSIAGGSTPSSVRAHTDTTRWTGVVQRFWTAASFPFAVPRVIRNALHAVPDTSHDPVSLSFRSALAVVAACSTCFCPK
jgi:hypothetical protein